jgi:hypothetical protein
VSVVADTAIFEDELDITALEAVKDSVSIVVADPVIVACLESICVCIADVTPSRYENSKLDTAPPPILVASIAAAAATLAFVITSYGIESFVLDKAPT